MTLENSIGIDAYGGDAVERKTIAERMVSAVRTLAHYRPEKTFVLVGENITLNKLIPEKPENVIIEYGADKKYGAVKKLAEMTAANDIAGFYSLVNTRILVPVVHTKIGTFEECSRAFPNHKLMPLLVELPKSSHVRRTQSWYALDVGGIPAITSDNYALYAQIGRLYARAIGKRQPVHVGLLNIGSEENKGTGALQEAHEKITALLADDRSGGQFIGNVEPYTCLFDRDKGREDPRPVDVVVTDAFAGNIMIKSLSAGADFLKEEIRHELVHSGCLGFGAGILSKPAYDRIKKRLTQYGVSKFPCSNAPVCKGHGTTERDGIIAGVEHLINYIDTKGTAAMRVAFTAYAQSPGRVNASAKAF